MQFVSPEELIKSDGLRIVVVKGGPSPWGQAAKAMMEYKGLTLKAALWQGGGANEEIVNWSGANSAPVVAWNKEKPIDRWDDILFLIERLAPQKPLLPESREERVQIMGLSHEICGRQGLGWNRRLSMFAPALSSGKAPEPMIKMGEKYGFSPEEAAQGDNRVIATLNLLTKRLKAQQAAGSMYFVGQNISPVDFYWAAFSCIIDLPPNEICPVPDAMRPMFSRISDGVRAAIDPVLLTHRDRIMKAHFKIPMEM
ncbi:MAG: hypothetical protein EXR08_03030 [Alphaproteobacteria bacterium]|nr:hypothetical protein [Alphaproteobacteria bacterium]